MHRSLIIVILIALISCQDNKRVTESIESDSLTTEQIDSVLNEFQFEYENPIILDSNDHVLIPISTELLKSRKSHSKDGYYVDDFPRYWNVLFYNVKKGESRLLTKDKFRITEINAKIETEYRQNESKVLPGKVLYTLGDIDFNGDGRLNGRDPNFLFISDTDGSNLIRISPKTEDLNYYQVIPNSSQIILRTLRDTNQDSVFNRLDKSIWYKAELNDGKWLTEEVIDSLQRKMIQRLYFEQWLKKKQ